MIRTGQTLIFDADDTLWENNVLFERVIDDFLEWIAHPTMDREAIRGIFDEIEAANVVSHGYGSKVFLHSLAECFGRLYERPANEQERVQIAELATALIEHRIELLPGVAEVLDTLAERHHLMLMTKGATDEQQAKIDASGLAHHFASVHIVGEKNTAAYLHLIADQAVEPSSAWMIGNSPKSDILPARRAGLNAVFIPNANTWRLEHDELDPSDSGVLTLAAFPELLQHF